MPNRLFYTIKLNSSLLKNSKYNLDIKVFNKEKSSGFNCLDSNFIISLADSQILKSIRDITGKKIDLLLLEDWYSERDSLKRKNKLTREEVIRIKELQQNIYNMMYIPEYITVVMENKKDYERMFKKGFLFNGKLYKRFSCSASQARVSTVVFVLEDIKEELKRRLDNGRNLEHLIAPTKYSAYFGLYSSATKAVTVPRFCIVKDFLDEQLVDVDYVIEKGENEDDEIEPRTMNIEFNRFDGSGLVSPQMSEKWGKDLDLDYTPCNFCLRYSFAKGMVNEYDFVDWCTEKNDGNYIIEDVWGKKIDLREIDVILSEGQVKLWDSWKSQKDYERCCEENGIIFGITKFSPKEDKKASTLNYQFIQTLNLDESQIKELCSYTVKYLKGVSYEDVYYTLLFLLGDGMSETKVVKYMKESDNYWLKTLILNHNLLNDKYTKEKIRENLIRQIEQACLGKLIVKGCFQCICPDPYAYMEWITGQEVRGLLKPHEAYNFYWNKEGATKVDSMRSPLTHFSEHGIDNLRNTEEMQKWYKYCYSGYICNIHDEFTMVHSGSDFDYDIIFSTDNKQFIDGAYKNQRVVTYDAKKPKKRQFTEEDLFIADTFSFGTRIGQITNVASSICTMIPNFKRGTSEREMLEKRVAMCCAAQSREIDKTKIGQSVKGTPSFWKQYMRLEESDTEEEKNKKIFYNSIMCDKKPYFFRYKYHDLNLEYNLYNSTQDEDCYYKFRTSLKELLSLNKEELTKEQSTFIKYYYKFLPVIDSNCVMNCICHYIENIDFDIKKKISNCDNFDYKMLMSKEYSFINEVKYKTIKEKLEIFFLLYKDDINIRKKRGRKANSKENNEKTPKDILVERIKEYIENNEMGAKEFSSYLLKFFYEDKISYPKSVLWKSCGKQIYENVLEKKTSVYFPVKDDNGDIEYLFEKYSLRKISLKEEKEEKEEREE